MQTMEAEIIEIIRDMDENQRQQVLNYARALKGKLVGEPAAQFIAAAQAMNIPIGEVEELERVIEEGFEQ